MHLCYTSLYLLFISNNRVNSNYTQVVAFSQEEAGQEEVDSSSSTQEVGLGDPAMILYTSGTTGPPKVSQL